MSKVRLRNLWFQIHKWIGIILAIILIPLSLTGSMLVWEEPIDRLLQPGHYAAGGPPAMPPSAYVAAARQALPRDSRIVGLTIDSGPVTVMAAPAQPSRMRGPPARLAVWIDAATGRVIDRGPSIAPILRWAHIFHGSLQIPGVGRAVVGWLGAAMLISSLTGLWLWWPLTGSVTRGLRWKRQPGFDANLHHLVGFWIALPLAMLSLTGVIIAWPQMIGSSGGMRRPPQNTPLAQPRLSVEQALAAAGAHGDFTIAWPSADQPAWKVTAAHAKPVLVDDATGTIVPSREGDRARNRPLYRRLHDGTGMGLLWQIIIVLAGLAPGILGVTGIIMWLRTRRWRGDVTRRRAAVGADRLP